MRSPQLCCILNLKGLRIRVVLQKDPRVHPEASLQRHDPTEEGEGHPLQRTQPRSLQRQHQVRTRSATLASHSHSTET